MGGNGVHQTEKLTLDNGFSRTLTADLAPGRYSIGMAAPLDVDPLFSILFGTAVGGTVPEPASWMTMILGFGAVGAVTRRGRRTARLTPRL